MTCLAPRCGLPELGLGVWSFLCLDHALAAHAGPSRAPERPDLRGRCWGDALTCSRPASTISPHGTYCASHAKAEHSIPPPRDAFDRAAEERAEQLATLAVMNAFQGANVEAIRANLKAPDYTPRPIRHRLLFGPVEDVPPAEWSRGVKGFTNAAKAGRWDFRVQRATAHDRVLLRAWRNALLIVAAWDSGSFTFAWLQHSSSPTIDLNATQAKNLLKAAP
jgi:hypothetical protein